MTNSFLVEIGTEELPPKALKRLAQAFKAEIETGLTAHDLSFSNSQWFATPRRLAIKVEGLIEQAPDKSIEVHGPPLAAAKDKEGNWTKAAIGFAKKNGVAPEQLSQAETPKGVRLAFVNQTKGQATSDLLPAIVESALSKLPIPKRMRWGARRDEFIRPTHWLVMLYGSDVVNCTILGVPAGNLTRGHRFHCDTTLEVTHPDNYESLLEQSGHVIADYGKRQRIIQDQVIAEGNKLNGEVVIDNDLLDEVTSLVEWPMALTGSFEQEFLQIPAEALIASMKEHQKYFHVVNQDNQLLPNFITVANIESADPSQVIAGNERVIRPRLSDAAFFFDTDKKQSLESRVQKLQTIVFQQKLGTVFDKSERIEKLARYIAEQFQKFELASNPDHAARAAKLSKTDLASDMVLEFDKMQGIAGRYYALNDGEPEAVAEAIKDQYLPKFSGDALPQSLTACAVGLADRLDTLVGIFGIDQAPTGSKDPFALRRASVSVLRILVEKQLPLNLTVLLKQALSYYSKLSQHETVVTQVLDYMIERFRAWYEDDGIPVQVFQAVNAKQITEPLDFDQRVKAVHAFYQLPEAASLAAANKRVSNILAKQNGPISNSFDNQLMVEPAEISLAKALTEKLEHVVPLFANKQYREGLAQLASLRDHVDHFFDQVMVMAEDEKLRNNRLALLNQLRDLFLQVADISLLASTGKD